MARSDADAYATQRTWQQAGLWQGRAPRLGQLDVELTERCNFDCIHCYINQPAGDRAIEERELSTAAVKGVLDEAAALGLLTVRFTGGEPLLRPDFAELYLHARRLGLKVLLFTNGSLITPAIADLFGRVPPLEKIEITIYGMAPESYTAVTGVPGAFAAVRRGIDRLVAGGVPFGVKGAVLPPNRGEQAAFETWAAHLPGMEQAPAYTTQFCLRGRRDSTAKNRQIQTLRPGPEAALALLCRREAEYRSAMKRFCAGYLGPQGDRLFRCGAGSEGACVDAYGQIQPCLLCRHPAAVFSPGRRPDGRSAGLRQALNEFFPALQERRAEDLTYRERCARCFIKGLCGQCPAHSWMEHGTLDTPSEYLCQVAHIQARHLGLLHEGEPAWEVADWPARLDRPVASVRFARGDSE